MNTIHYSLFPIHYSLFTIPYSLFPIPYSLFPVPYSLFIMKLHYSLPLLGYAACFFILSTPIDNPAQANFLIKNPPLILSQETINNNNQTVVSGENGQYRAEILVNASAAALWGVLTDYNNFNQFIPNVTSSEVIESKGETNIIEQISQRTFLGIPIKTVIRTENLEIDREQINFTLIDGDLSKLEGYWKIEPVASSQSGDRVLLIHQVEAQPPAGIPADIFYDIFEDSLAPTLDAIRQEAENN